MEKIKGYADKIDDFEVLAYLRDEFKESFPETPESSPDEKNQPKRNDYESQSDDDDELSPEKPKKKSKKSKSKDRSKRIQKKDEEDKNGMFQGMKSFFRISKKEEQIRKKDSTESKKLPKNFANRVLDYELKIDSGNFDISTIDKLMQLYSQAVEYYSGMNDEKYLYFTERI
jgi:hypothetical protein